MSRVLVTQLSISLDGYGTGEPQTLDEPFGHAGQRLHRWLFADEPGGDRVSTGVDAAFGAVGWDGSVGAEIMGRRKFWPYAGEWTDPEWKGWWGPNPPFHTPVFVLTHHPRESIVMEGGTTFHFLDATPEEAVSRAKEAAAGKDVRIGGGPSTVREFVRAGVVDVMHVVVVPIVLGRGESLWEGLGDIDSRFDVEAVASPASGVTHLTFTRKASLMARLRYGMLVSLDGYARDDSGSFDWATPDDELHGYVNDRERDVRTLVYGRGLWETMRWWQDSPADDEPGAAPEHHDFAAMWRQADKIVVSTTLEPPAEPRTELWPTLDLDRLAALVRDSPTDVSIGGPTLAAHALRAGLVDEVTAYVVPHLAGGGLPWLPTGVTTGLVLREQRRFGSGAVALTYDVTKG